MKPLTLWLSLALLAWACTSPKQNEQAEEETAQQTTTAAPEAEADRDKGTNDTHHQVSVLDSSIASPRKRMTATLDGLGVEVVYGSPSVKGRTIWGELVPYGEVWRTGANEATTISFDQDVTVAGEPLPAGTYAFFTLPDKSEWTLIFNGEPEQFGAFEYEENQDVLRVQVSPKAGVAMSETMEFAVQGDQLVLLWDRLMVPIPVKKA